MGHLEEMLTAGGRLRGLRRQTIRLYTENVRQVERYFGERPLTTLSLEDLRGYFLHLVEGQPVTIWSGGTPSSSSSSRVVSDQSSRQHALTPIAGD